MSKVAPEIVAASVDQTLDIIEKYLSECKFEGYMKYQLTLGIQEYLKDPSQKNNIHLKELAQRANLWGVSALTQKIRNSPEFQDLVAFMTPDDESFDSKKGEWANSDPEIVAVNTTAKAIATKADKPSKVSKASKPIPKMPMPVIADVSALESLSRPKLIAAMKALNEHKQTLVKANASSSAIKQTLALHILGITDYQPSTKTAKAPKLPVPSIADVSALESMDRPKLIAAVKAVKSHNPEVTIRANAATVELQKTLAFHILGVDYQPQTSKSGKKQEILELPEGFSWEIAKDMNYRQLQQICKALRSQGLFQGNIGGKGATKEALRKGVADYFRGLGVNIVEVTVKNPSPAKDLHLPHLAALQEQRRLERLATAALKLSDEEARVELEQAVAA